jgi:hypothetical protein
MRRIILLENSQRMKKVQTLSSRRTRKSYHQEFEFWEPYHQESHFLIPQLKCFEFNQNN